MARLGVDFGSTNTIAVAHDRGMFSEVLHTVETAAGTIVQPIFPSAILIEKDTGQRWFGIEADRRFGRFGPSEGHVFISSLKRRLHSYSEGRTKADGGRGAGGNDESAFDLAELLRGFLAALADSIRRSQSLPADEELEAVITWPANANGAQRHITRACFRDAGFEVLDTLNEPTAAAIELADCLTAARDRGRQREPSAVAVFDLGGGTFDASVVWVDGDDFHVLASGGVQDLGGDDFDAALLEMFLDAMRHPADDLTALTRHALLRQARAQKESICSGTIGSLFVNPADFGLRGRPVSVSVDAFFERVRPLIKPAMRMLGHVIKTAADAEPRVGSCSPLTTYLVGGSSKLPLVSQMVAEAFPHQRVLLSDKPFRSVAVGAAICATQRVTFRDVFARHFGLIRLRDHGRAECFDTIFPAGTPIPRKGEPPIEKMAWYAPRHNIGHLRYLECTAVTQEGQPDGSVRAWSDVLFPYDPVVSLNASLSRDDIVETDRFAGERVCEVYRCDRDGVITVELRRPTLQDARTYEIFRD